MEVIATGFEGLLTVKKDNKILFSARPFPSWTGDLNISLTADKVYVCPRTGGGPILAVYDYTGKQISITFEGNSASRKGLDVDAFAIPELPPAYSVCDYQPLDFSSAAIVPPMFVRRALGTRPILQSYFDKAILTLQSVPRGFLWALWYAESFVEIVEGTSVVYHDKVKYNAHTQTGSTADGNRNFLNVTGIGGGIKNSLIICTKGLDEFHTLLHELGHSVSNLATFKHSFVQNVQAPFQKYSQMPEFRALLAKYPFQQDYLKDPEEAFGQYFFLCYNKLPPGTVIKPNQEVINFFNRLIPTIKN